MRVKIGAHSPLGVPHLACAGRFFPTNGYREVEVLDQEEDPPPQINKVRNPTTDAIMDLEVPDQAVMGRKSYQLILDDGRFTVQETAGIDARISGAEVAAARAEVGRQAAIILDHQGTIAKMTAERDIALARVAELKAATAAVPATTEEPKGKKK